MPSSDTVSWPLLPGPWLPLDEGESVQFRLRLQAYLEVSGLDLMTASVETAQDLRAMPLSFYSGWLLVSGDVATNSGMVGTFDVLMGPGFFSVLDGSSNLIHALNGGRLPRPGVGSPWKQGARPARSSSSLSQAFFYASPLLTWQQNPTAAADYLRFFCSAVRGPSGSFRLLETEAQLRQCGVADRGTWVSKLKPLDVTPHQSGQGSGSEGLFCATSLMLYGGDLCEVLLYLYEGGAVAMPSDERLAQAIAPMELSMGVLRDIRAAAPSV